MLITNCKNPKIGRYDGFTTYLLIGEHNSGSKEISIQITDVESGSMQSLHSHEQEQCYYIVTGKGSVYVNDETNIVCEGDAVFIPSNAIHGIRNIGTEKLVYLTANQAFGVKKENEIWSE